MLRAKNIWVMGGDPRQAALAALLADAALTAALLQRYGNTACLRWYRR